MKINLIIKNLLILRMFSKEIGLVQMEMKKYMRQKMVSSYLLVEEKVLEKKPLLWER